MKKSNLLEGDALLMEPLVVNEHLLEGVRPKAALGNMKTHLYLTDPAAHWVSVGRADLQAILEYVSELEAKVALSENDAN